jgi:hypothetical protein
MLPVAPRPSPAESPRGSVAGGKCGSGWPWSAGLVGTKVHVESPRGLWQEAPAGLSIQYLKFTNDIIGSPHDYSMEGMLNDQLQEGTDDDVTI